EPMVDLMALAEIDRETEVSYIRKERDWLQRAIADGRYIEGGRVLTVLPARLTTHGGGDGSQAGNGHHATLEQGASMRAWLYLIAAAIGIGLVVTPAIAVFLLGGGSFD